ncbi:hypothetical protein NECAME_00343 [Necator americanus]|uniref:Uncharacterized protein n=1 Tax=Necator americanus TaxID=51031 RepID=W2TAA9_NECAM|nr:hypothetical protein NECAME_00343 [Necator americanus]ETN78970.1 hypothetical protein NECAME_00343 [Necator americanus]
MGRGRGWNGGMILLSLLPTITVVLKTSTDPSEHGAFKMRVSGFLVLIACIVAWAFASPVSDTEAAYRICRTSVVWVHDRFDLVRRRTR